MKNLPAVKEKAQPRLKVRLTTSVYSNKDKVTFKKELYFYKRPNPEHLPGSIIDDLRDSAYPDQRIINLYEVPDGIYEVIWCNISHDWETGYVDNWDLKLIPWEE